MTETCLECEQNRDEIKKLNNEIYYLCKSNIKSQKNIEDKYRKKIENLIKANNELEDQLKEYQQYKRSSEFYYKDVNNTLIIAKAKLKELQDRIFFLEKSNSELYHKYNETRSVLNVLLEQDNHKYCNNNNNNIDFDYINLENTYMNKSKYSFK